MCRWCELFTPTLYFNSDQYQQSQLKPVAEELPKFEKLNAPLQDDAGLGVNW